MEDGRNILETGWKTGSPHNLHLLASGANIPRTIFFANGCRSCATLMPGTSASPTCPAFLRLIAPALERHIAESAIVGYSGEVKISFYRSGAKAGIWTKAGW